MEKYLRLEEEHLNLLEEIKEKQNIKTDTKAMKYILDEYIEYQKKEYIITKIVEKYNKQFDDILKGIKATTADLEDKMTIITDILNTELILQKKEQCIPLKVMESPVITQSKQHRKYNKGKKIQTNIYRKKAK